MKMSELAALKLSTAIVTLAVRGWLTSGGVTESELSLNDLITGRVEGRLEQRRVLRSLEQAIDSVAERLITSTALQFPSLTQEEKNRVANSLAIDFGQAARGAEPTVSNIDLAAIERYVRSVSDRSESNYNLSSESLRFREYLIEESSAYLASIAEALPDFSIGALNELLRRERQILDLLRSNSRSCHNGCLRTQTTSLN